MARPPLAMGTHGSISVNKPAGSKAFSARCRFRDFDGKTRWLERHGPTKTKARARASSSRRGSSNQYPGTRRLW